MLRIGRLTVENLTKECVTDNPRPRFSYYLESDRENVSLKSAVIRMNGWSTVTEDQVAVPYGGPELEPFTRYAVTVQDVYKRQAVYMSVCQAMNGQGGWPLTIIMTPACRPFFSGTYLSPKARYGRVGLEELLTAVAGQWKTNRGKLLDLSLIHI